jgi:hypothetical protein
MLAPDVHAVVVSTQPEYGPAGVREFAGVDEYMVRKTKAAQLIESGSVRVLSAIGDETGALVTVTFRMRLGAGGTMVTMARACLYLVDGDKKIKEERDIFFVPSEK